MRARTNKGPLQIEINFLVVEGLKRPILSVPELARGGFTVMFESGKRGAKATIWTGSVRLFLVEISGMFYLEADSTEQKWIPSEKKTRSPKGKQSDGLPG